MESFPHRPLNPRPSTLDPQPSTHCEHQPAQAGPRENLAGTRLPRAFVTWVIEHEQVQRLEDLIERRLMLLYRRNLSKRCVRELAACLFTGCGAAPEEIDAAVEEELDRLRRVHGRDVT